MLLAACLSLTIGAAPAMRYLQEAARTVLAPGAYIGEVLRAP
jgi:multicomponent K+:H+ antiporter subunit D